MKIAKSLINLDKEFEAVVNFIKLRWNTSENVEVMLPKAWDKGIVLYKEQSLTSCSQKYNDYILKPELFKDFVIDDKNADTVSYYHPYSIFMKFFLKLGESTIFNESSLPFSFSDVEKYIEAVLKEYPEYKKMKPLINPEDCDYDEVKDAKSFKGVESETATSLNFPYNVYIAGEYEGKERSVRLLLAVIMHAAYCQKHNNNVILKREIEKVDKYFRSFGTEIPFNVSFKNVTKNKFLLDVLSKAEKHFLSEEELRSKQD